MLVLVVRGTLEEALAKAADHLGRDLPVLAADARGQETIIHTEEPLGHDVHRWYAEHGDLIWFNTDN